MIKQVVTWAYMIPAAVSITSLTSVLAMIYLLLAPSDPIYRIKNPQNHYAYVSNGSVIVHREFCITDDTKMITINRDMVSVGKDLTLRVTLPTTSQLYKKGCASMDRVLDLPDDTPPGKYELDFIASWNANTLKVDVVKLPVLTIVVGTKTK